MNRNDWRKEWIVFAWVWVAGMTCLGTGLLVASSQLSPEDKWINKGIGTSVLLVAASILFVAVLGNLEKAGKDVLALVASILAAVFVYGGTIKVLQSENPLLLAVVLIATFYIGWTGISAVLIFRMFRSIFSKRS